MARQTVSVLKQSQGFSSFCYQQSIPGGLFSARVILIFSVPSCLCVFVRRVQRAQDDMEVRQPVGSYLQKGNRKRPLREKGDRRGGEGVTSEVMFKKRQEHKREERNREVNIDDLLQPNNFLFCLLGAPSDLSSSDSLFGTPLRATQMRNVSD